MSAPKDLRALLELHHEKFPASAGTDILRFSETDESDPSTYEGGYKEGRLSAIQGPERAISDPGGDHFVGQVTIAGDDTDHFWRARLDDPETAYLDGRDGILKVVSEAVKRVLGVWTILFRGKARELPTDDGLGWSLVLEEWIGSQFGPAFLDRTLQRPFRREIFTDIDRALLDATQFCVPQIYGEQADGVKGKCPGFYVGKRTFAISGPTPPQSAMQEVLLPPPPAPTEVSRSGSGGSKSWDYACCVRTLAGGRTTLGAFATFTNLPNGSAFTPSNYIRLALAQYSAELQVQVQGIDLYVRPSNETGAPWKYMDAAGQMFTSYYEDNGDDSKNKPWNPPPSKNTAYVTQSYVTEGGPGVSKTYGMIVFADSAVHELLALYGPSGSEDGVVERVPISLGILSDVVDSTNPLWPDPNPWWDIVGTDGVTERFFGVYVSGFRLQQAIDGRVTFAADICGRPEDANDPTTPPIDQTFLVWQHLLSQALANDGQGYRTGAWAGLPTFADGAEAISAASAAVAQAFSALLLGTAKGFLSGFCIDKPVTLREFLRGYNRNFTSFTYAAAGGPLSIGLVNTNADAATGVYLREDIDDVVTIGAPREQKPLVENRVTSLCDFDADAKKYLTDPETINDVDSQTAHKAVRDRGVYEGRYTWDVATMRCAMNQRLLLFGRAPRHIPVTTGTNGFGIELMTQCLVTGHEGLGPTGYVLRPAIPIRHVDRVSDGEVDHLLWDLGPILARLGPSSDIVAGVRTWSDAADGETWADGGGKVWG